MDPLSSKSARNLTEKVCDFLHCWLVHSLTYPEYFQVVRAVGIGFIMMGVVGYAVKLLHIPIRYLIV